MKIFFFALLFPSLIFAGDLSFNTGCDPASNQAILSFVGDILIHKPLYLSAINGSKHFTSIWEKTIPLLLKADFSVGNVEGPVAMGLDKKGHDHGDVGFIYDDFIYSGTNLVFNYHPRLLSDLQDSGFDLVTAANNHALDRFSAGIDKTILAAENIGLKITGVKKSTDLRNDFYSVATIKNIRTAFIGCSEVLNDHDSLGQVLNCESSEIFTIIKNLSFSNEIDAIVVLPHWGVEYSSEEKQYQRDYAHRYIEAGAIAVIGSHPHVLQPWEKYVSKNKREGLIFYSLGNFVAYQEGTEKQTGAILYLGLTKAPNEKAKIFASAYAPTYRENLSVVPLSLMAQKEANENVTHFYGAQKRIQINDLIWKKMCQKN